MLIKRHIYIERRLHRLCGEATCVALCGEANGKPSRIHPINMYIYISLFCCSYNIGPWAFYVITVTSH